MLESKAIQQIIFTGKIKLTVANILKQSKEITLQNSKGTTKIL